MTGGFDGPPPRDELVLWIERTLGGRLSADETGYSAEDWERAAAAVEADPELRAESLSWQSRDDALRRSLQRLGRGADDALVAGVLRGMAGQDQPTPTGPTGTLRPRPFWRPSLRVAAAAALLIAVPSLAFLAARGPLSASEGFVDVAVAAGIERVGHAGSTHDKRWMVEVVGHGAAALDYDRDGDLDLFVPDGHDLEPDDDRPSTWRLYRNDGGFRFADVTAEAGLDRAEWGCGAVAGDLDGDGWTDLFVPCWGRNLLFRNRGDGTFEDVTERAGVAGLDEEWSTAAALGDVDGDGDLDLYVANYADIWAYMRTSGGMGRNCKWKDLDVPCGPTPLAPQRDRLYLNDGTGRFADVSAERLPVDRRYSFQPVLADFDGDGHVDVFVAADDHPNLFLVNDGTGHFRELAEQQGVAYDAEGLTQACMGVAYGDSDGDGRGDLFVTNFSHEANVLYRSNGTAFRDATAGARLAAGSQFTLGWGTTFFDYDLDGALDLAIANGHLYPDVEKAAPETSYEQPLSILSNDGSGVFTDRSHALGSDVVDPRVHGGLLVADFDDDGRADVFVTVLGERAVLLRNRVPPAGGHVRLSLFREGGVVEAAGAKVRVKTSGPSGSRVLVRDLLLGSSFACSEDPRLLVGLGDATSVDEVEVVWPGGRRQSFGPLTVGRAYRLVEGTDAAEAVR